MPGTSILVSDTEEEGPAWERCAAAGWAARLEVSIPRTADVGQGASLMRK